MARWAKQWVTREVWDHRLRVMLGFRPQDVDWAREHCTVERLARMWKSYLADSDYAMDEKLSGVSTSYITDPSLR